MALFEEAYKKTMHDEGGYSNNPADVGGETYKGVSRRYHPDWKGWNIIDKHKADTSSDSLFFRALSDDDTLELLVRAFYKKKFWNRFLGSLIPNQQIAEELFDNAVNLGVHRSVLFLQEALNLLNRNQRNYKDILEDGIIGSETLNTLKTYLSIDKPKYLLKIMNILQGMHYISYMKKSPTQEIFARGWLERVCI